MCEKCVKRGKKAKMHRGKIKYFAIQLLRGYPIPIFADTKANYAIEGEAYSILRRKTKKYKYDYMETAP